jgi:hypothetical protein
LGSGPSAGARYALSVACCCNPRGCDQFFSPRLARRMARRYRKRGLDAVARRMVEFLEQRGIEGATVLEVGGGVGEVQIELLKRGAARAVNLELSSAYEEEAGRLLREAGLEGRAERRLHDIAVDREGVEPADEVVLHRVVCCYPDYERLLGAVADRARRLVVFSYPRETRSRACSSPPRASSSSCCARSSGRSPIRRRRCSPCSASSGSAARSPIAGSSGRWRDSSVSLRPFRVAVNAGSATRGGPARRTSSGTPGVPVVCVRWCCSGSPSSLPPGSAASPLRVRLRGASMSVTACRFASRLAGASRTGGSRPAPTRSSGYRCSGPICREFFDGGHRVIARLDRPVLGL